METLSLDSVTGSDCKSLIRVVFNIACFYYSHASGNQDDEMRVLWTERDEEELRGTASLQEAQG
jgi:hypothetical protein